jgi:hypothetical protein
MSLLLIPGSCWNVAPQTRQVAAGADCRSTF